MPFKILTSTIIFFTLLVTTISTSANIIDDLKNKFGQDKINSSSESNRARNQEQNQEQNESKKICDIRKDYTTKHFESRQNERSNDIEKKIININRIKTLFSNNKQEIGNLNSSIENLTKLLKQKIELLKSRVSDANSIDCQNREKSTKIRTNLRDLNKQLNKIDKDIQNQTRDFGLDVEILLIKLTDLKI